MKLLKGAEETKAKEHMMVAAEVAKKSPCFRRKCGTVIVSNGEVIAEGYNAPPLDEKITSCRKDVLPKDFKSDKTCCIHAEQRAIMDGLRRNASKMTGSSLYFIAVNGDGSLEKAGKPYCTICSKMALDAGVSEFILWHESGITVYNTKEYNELSFEHKGD